MTAVPEIDVERIMRQIREDIARARAAGVGPLAVADPGSVAGPAVADVVALQAAVDIRNIPLTSHRGLLGPIVVATKRLLRKLLTPILERQVTHNTASARLIGQLGQGLEALGREQAGLRAEAAAARAEARRAIDEGLAAANERLRAIEGKLHALGAGMETLEQAQRQGHDQVATLHRQQRQDMQDARERVARAERRLRRIVHALSLDGDMAGDLPAAAPGAAAGRPTVGSPGASGGASVEFDHAGFQERFRGSEEEIKERQRVYLPYFKGITRDVLDIGCGRGEFLGLLREAGLEARGIDLDLDTVLLCRDKGLDVVHAEALAYLESLPDESLAAIFCAQVIEHLESRQIMRLVQLAHGKLRTGGLLILETPNPRCLTVFAETFYIDLSHLRLIHPGAAQFLLESTGFVNVEMRFSSPVAEAARVPPLPAGAFPAGALADFNRGVERLNELLYGPQDYAAIGRKAPVLA